MTEMLKTKQEGRMLLSLKPKSGARQEHRSSAGAVILMIPAITLTCSTAAFAQNEDKVKAGVTAWRNSGCPGGGGNLYPAPSKLSPEEIDNVVAYLQTRIVGKGKITKQECLLYYTDKPDWCDDYN